MSTTKRATARAKGLQLAARVATVGGIAACAFGLVEARAASASSASSAPRVTSSDATSADDAKPLPMENLGKVAAGGCGCAPCWGPPAPPSKTLRGEA